MSSSLLPNDLQPGEPVLVSSCLLGKPTTWKAESKENSALLAFLERAGVEIIPVCPEMLGGLPAPRPPAEPAEGGGPAVWKGEQTILTVGGADPGKDVTASFLQGAEQAVELARQSGARYAFLKERSPSCGVSQSHVGGRIAALPGVATVALREAGLTVVAGDPPEGGQSAREN